MDSDACNDEETDCPKPSKKLMADCPDWTDVKGTGSGVVNYQVSHHLAHAPMTIVSQAITSVPGRRAVTRTVLVCLPQGRACDRPSSSCSESSRTPTRDEPRADPFRRPSSARLMSRCSASQSKMTDHRGALLSPNALEDRLYIIKAPTRRHDTVSAAQM